MLSINSKISIFICALFLASCASQAPLATIPARQVDAQRISFGSAQMLKSRVDKGDTVSGDDVIKLLGSPNIVSANPDNTETWVFDKVSTEQELATGQNTAVQVRTTRTMMVVVKFNQRRAVENVTYRQTSY
jgi:outer membrane protein assembly factor BamE (lipoprotein component of BamABCDE complex)